MKSKIIFCALVLALLFANLNAQQITGYSYFLYPDPGFNNGSFIAVTEDADISASITLTEFGTLPTGIYTLGIRTLDTDGKWSHTITRSFQVIQPIDNPAAVVKGEYYFDLDPGFDLGFALTDPIPLNDVSMNEVINNPNLQQLNTGLHRVGFRVQDDQGQWSHTIMRSFNKVEIPATPIEISKIEFGFYNPLTGSDQGFTNEINATFELVDVNTYLIHIDPADLPFTDDNSAHQLFIRVMDESGQWSHTISGVSSEYIFVDFISGSLEEQSQTLCANSEVTEIGFAEQAESIEPNITYQWYSASGIVPSPTVSTVDTGIWTLIDGAVADTFQPLNLTADSTSACFVTSGTFESWAENAAQFTITPLPTILELTGESDLCENTSASYAASATNADSFAWTLPNEFVGASTENAITITAGSASGLITVIPSNECGNGQAASLSVNVLPTITPVVELTASDLEICEGEEITFTATPVNNSGGDSPTYQWFINDIPETTTQPTLSSSDINDGDQVTVSMASNALCASPQNATALVSSISVFPLPETPVITQIGDMLNSSSPIGNQWYMNGALIEGATDVNYTPSANGEYSVVVTSDNGCGSSESNVLIVIIDNVDDYGQSILSVYPNPFIDELRIQLNAQNMLDEITVIDATGRTVFSQNNLPSPYLINTSNWATGLYFIRLTFGGHSKEFKLSKI